MGNALFASTLLLIPADRRYVSAGLRWHLPGWGQQTEQNASQLESLTQVTITDPAHPLFGQSLPLVHHSSPRGKENVTLLLANGQHRSVPRATTSLEATVEQQRQRRRLPLISIRTILPLSQFIKSKLLTNKEEQDVPANNNPETGLISSSDKQSRIDKSPLSEALAPVRVTSSAASDSTVGATHSENSLAGPTREGD